MGGYRRQGEGAPKCHFLRSGDGRDRPCSAGGSDGLQARRPARAAPLRSPSMGMEAFDTAAASPSSMYDGARCSSNRFLGVEFQICTDAVMLIPGIAGFLPCDSLVSLRVPGSVGRHCSRPRQSSLNHGVASRNCVQRLIAIDLETHIWPSLDSTLSSGPPAWLPHSSDKQDIGRSQNASNSCRANFLCTL
uniref:Uncharacterized protein n=1 Tax=Oryza punctata TaxID=4537 RepID=A0A0E0MN58_ORYPU